MKSNAINFEVKLFTSSSNYETVTGRVKVNCNFEEISKSYLKFENESINTQERNISKGFKETLSAILSTWERLINERKKLKIPSLRSGNVKRKVWIY